MDRPGSGRVASRPSARAVRRAAWATAYALLAASPLLLLIVGEAPRPRGFAVELAAGLGYIALGMLCLQLVLGARPRVVVNELGLDAVLLFHRAAGLWLTAFVIAHLALLAVAEPRFAAALIDPRGRHGVVMSLSLAGLALLVLVPRQLTRLRIPYEAWRVAHGAVAVVVVAIALWHVRSVGRASADPAERALVTTVVGVALALPLGARAARATRSLFRAWRVVEVRGEGDRVFTIAIEAVGHEGLSFRPGQSIWLTLGRSPFSPRQHPFTVASSAASPRRLELTIKELGDFTRGIGRTPIGARAYVAGPYGAMTLDVEDRRSPTAIVCVAGGIGITPMMSILRTLRDLGDRRPVLLFQAASTLERLVFSAEIEGLSRALDLRVVQVFESPPPGFSGERGVIGRDVLARHLTGVFAEADVFVCGPEPMINLVERALRDFGVRDDRVRTEHFALVGSRPPGGSSLRERHVRALASGIALALLVAAAIVAGVRGS